MPAQRLPMRQVREVLRLKHACGQSDRLIAAAIGVSRYTVAEYLRRAAVVGIAWPVPAGLDDAALQARLFSPPFTPREALRPQPDWGRVHAELRRPGVTLLLLWQEYRAEHAEGYGYSRFCDLYAGWRGGVPLTMRQTHLAGDKLFVDFAGQTLAVVVDSVRQDGGNSVRALVAIGQAAWDGIWAGGDRDSVSPSMTGGISSAMASTCM